ncbi:YcbK family protein [Wukongibacter sp. M2B1]|uniref:YcbK family protein n=1 Tax=Wukongibacter sp. M2B1 TaxID=3088895 RepID=UPI003D7AA164
MYKVIKDIKLSNNFKLSEFVCKEGKNEVYVDIKLINKLQLLRKKLDKPIVIISGYRSPSYNKRVGGSPKSQHLEGKAVDIKKVKGISDEEFIKIVVELGFTGVGLYDGFWHIDVRDNPHSRGYSFWDMR